MRHKLSNGIIISFAGKCPTIYVQRTKFCKLEYSWTKCFYISTISLWVSPQYAIEYAKELTELAAVCNEANEILKQRNK